MPFPVYLTLQEYTAWIRELEAVNQSNEGEDMTVNGTFVEICIRTATGDVLGALVPVWGPIPNTDQIKFSLIAPIAHWYAEKQGEKRSYIQAEYDRAIELLSAIQSKTTALLDANGTPIVINPDVTSRSELDYGYQVNTADIWGSFRL